MKPPDPRHRAKVFGIGFPKTGTKTLGTMLRRLGYDHTSYDMDLALAARQGRLEPIFAVADRHESFEDWPWFLVYEELDARYPRSRFILTRRRDTPTYERSLRRHHDRQGVHMAGFERPHWWDAVFAHHGGAVFDYDVDRADYERHNEAVRAYFADRPDDLLELCWEEGDGWEPLCHFLGHPVPDEPIPHANRARSALLPRMYRRLERFRRRRYGRR